MQSFFSSRTFLYLFLAHLFPSYELILPILCDLIVSIFPFKIVLSTYRPKISHPCVHGKGSARTFKYHSDRPEPTTKANYSDARCPLAYTSSSTTSTFPSAKLPTLPCPGWNLLRRDNSFVGFLPFLWVLWRMAHNGRRFVATWTEKHFYYPGPKIIVKHIKNQPFTLPTSCFFCFSDTVWTFFGMDHSHEQNHPNFPLTTKSCCLSSWRAECRSRVL